MKIKPLNARQSSDYDSSGKDGRKLTIKLRRSGESSGHESSGKNRRKGFFLF